MRITTGKRLLFIYAACVDIRAAAGVVAEFCEICVVGFVVLGDSFFE